MCLSLSLARTGEEFEEIRRLREQFGAPTEEHAPAREDGPARGVCAGEELTAHCNGLLVGAVRVSNRGRGAPPQRSGAREREGSPARSASVTSLVIRPEWRGTGLAARLVGAAAGLAQTDGIRYLLVDWHDHVRPSLERLGFRPEAQPAGEPSRPVVVLDVEDRAHLRRLRSPFFGLSGRATEELARSS